MVRYLLSLVIYLCGITFGLISVGVSIFALLDLPSFIFVGIFPFLFVSTLYGFKDMALAFSIPFKKENTQDSLIKALAFIQKYGYITWISGLIAVIIGFIGMMANLDDPAAIGPNLALCVISLLYSGIINVLIVIPFLLLIKKQMK
jgi:flagellar motor component MotA